MTMKADTEIQSVDQYKKYLERYQNVYPDGLYFRGEADDYPDHRPSIARDNNLLQNESNILRRYISEQSDEEVNSIIVTLAKIQHYGSMTRLVDLTIDPLVALYFASESQDDKPGFVFMYIPNGTEKEFESKEVRALSLYVSEDVKSEAELNNRYAETYDESIDVATCCSKTFIMKYDERLFSNNERMKLQKGAFAICGADVSKLPERTVIPFDIASTRTFMIPAGFKAVIKKELEEIGVRPVTIYPEEYSTLSRIKAELSKPKDNIDLKSCYEVIENSGLRNKIFFKDLEMKIKLTHPLDNDSVKEIVRLETWKYTDEADVVWTYVANCDMDIQISNWRLRGKWIRTGIALQTPLRERDKDGFSWDVTSGAVIHSLWMQENGFGDDKEELCKYIKAFRLVLPEMEKAREYAIGDKEKPVLPWCSMAHNIDVLYANNRAMEGVFKAFESFFSDAMAVHIIVDKEERRLLSYELETNVSSDEKKLKAELPYWIQKLDITEKDIETAEPFTKGRRIWSFKPTIPMGESPLLVSFEVTAKVNKEGRAEITGSTNLFNEAILMIKLDKRATGKLQLEDGAFFCVLGAPGCCHVGERHIITIILPVPSIQPLEFVKKAGMEYENLDGAFIKRDGLGVSGEMDIEVVME